MGTKKYEIKHITYLSTDVTVNGKILPVLFEGGTNNNPDKIRAKFITANIDIQKEIEKRADFGTEIILTYEETPSVPTPIIIPEGFEDIKGITTGVEARDLILVRFPEVKHSELKSIAMIKEVAAKNKIIFSELI